MLSTSNISFRVALSNDIPAALGVADAGVGTEGSKSDHVHAAPNSTDITDSTATGQSLITAANAAAARAAVLLPEERRVIPLCGYVTNAGPLTAHGRVRIDPADYVVAGRTLVATLETLAEVSVGGLSAEITLVDVTHASAVVATVTETATATTRQSPGATLHTDAAVYELQSVLTGVGYVGFAANLILTWSTP